MAGTIINYQLIAAFVAVVEQSSFTRAARKLGTGKSTVSRAVAQLEEQVGVELLLRSSRSVALSTAGAALYERAAGHLAALDQALSGLPERDEVPSGELRITAPHDFGAVVLPPLLARFSRRYPAISFDIRLSNHQVDIVAEGFDLAIRVTGKRLKDSSLTVRRLGSPKFDFYAAPSYLARRGRPRRCGEEGHDWVLHPAFLPMVGVSRERVRFLVDDLLLIREMVREGAGISCLPHFLSSADTREGLLERIPIALPSVPAGGGLVLLYSSSKRLPRKVTAFCDFLLEQKLMTLLD